MEDDARGRKADPPPPPSAVSDGRSEMTSMRGNVYSLAAGLWHLFGIDWLFVPESTPAVSVADPAAITVSSWWWFPPGREIGDKRRPLGPVWPLCALVRMAAGEYRIGLGRLIAAFKEGACDPSVSSSLGGRGALLPCLVSEVDSCARIIAEAVRLMNRIADDGNAGASPPPVVWSPDAILHICVSVENALSLPVQYSNDKHA